MKHAYLLVFLLLAARLPATYGQNLAFSAAEGFSPEGLAGQATGKAVAVDAAGNQYVTGSFSGTIKLGTATLTSDERNNVFVAKRAANTGAWLWAVRSHGRGDAGGTGIAVSAAGAVLVTGSYNAASGLVFATSAPGASVPTYTALSGVWATDIFVARFDAATGACAWAVSAGGGDDDQATAVAVDGSGNAYVTGWLGRFGTDPVFTTSAAGVLPATTFALPSGSYRPGFVARFDGGTGACAWAMPTAGVGEPRGQGIAVDAAGAVFVTGAFNGTAEFFTSPFGATTATTTPLVSAGLDDVFLLRLASSTGACTWAVRAGGVHSERGMAVAVDGRGNVFVTGFYFLTAYFTTSAPGTSPATTLALPPATSADVFVARFAGATGACAWAVAAGGSTYDWAYAMAADANGDVTVAGSFQGTATFTTSAPGTSPATTTALVMSGNTDAFVARFSGATGACAWASSAGSREASTGVRGMTEAWGVAVDAAGTAYATGSFQVVATFGSPADAQVYQGGMFLAGLSAGAGTWQPPAVPATGGTSYGTALATDAAGNQYLAGSFAGSMQVGSTRLYSWGRNELYLAKRSPTGAWLWAVQTKSTEGMSALGVATDASGHIFVTGQLGTGNYGVPVAVATTFVSSAAGVLPATTLPLPIAGGADGFLARFDAATGACAWAVSFGSTSGERGRAVAVDGNGAVFVAGETNRLVRFTTSAPGTVPATTVALPSVGGTDGFVARFSAATGACAWAMPLAGLDANQATALAADSRGGLYVAGLFEGSAPFVTSAFGSSPATHLTLTSAGDADAFVARLDPATGACAWAVPLSGVGDAIATALALDPSGIPFVAGTFAGTGTLPGPASGPSPGTRSFTAAGETDLFLARLDPATGAAAWAVAAGSIVSDEATSLAANGQGELYVGGFFRQSALFVTSAPGTSPATTTALTTGPRPDLLVARFAAATGACTGAIAAGSPADDTSIALALAPDGTAYATGEITAPATFGPFTLAATAATAYIAAVQLAAPTATAVPIARPSRLQAHPNPARNVVHVASARACSTPFLLIDNLGRTIHTWPAAASGTTATLPLPTIAPGLYTLRCGPASTRLAVE